MVDNGYWVECFPVVQKEAIDQDLYTASIESFPYATCTGESIDQAINKLRLRLLNIQKACMEDGLSLPKAHSLSCPTSRHRQEENWMSVYISLEENKTNV